MKLKDVKLNSLFGNIFKVRLKPIDLKDGFFQRLYFFRPTIKCSWILLQVQSDHYMNRLYYYIE